MENVQRWIDVCEDLHKDPPDPQVYKEECQRECVKLFNLPAAAPAVNIDPCSSAAGKQLRLFQLLVQWDGVFNHQLDYSQEHYKRGLGEVKEELLKLMDDVRVLNRS